MPEIHEDVSNPASSREAVDRVLDAAKRAAHLTHEAGIAKSMMQDAVEDKIYAAKRALKLARRRVEQFQDYRDEAIRYVRRRPVTLVAIALASGLMIGVGFGWAASRRRHAERREARMDNR